MENEQITFEQHIYASRGGNVGYEFLSSSNNNIEGIPISKPSASEVAGRTVRLHYVNERIFLVCVYNAPSVGEERISEHSHYFEYVADKPLSQCNPLDYLSAFQLVEIHENSFPISQITCQSLGSIEQILKKYYIDDNDKLARFFEGVYRAFFWNKKGYTYIVPTLFPEQSLEQISCELMAILHHFMPNMRRRLTFISNSDGKIIPQFGFAFSRTSREISSDNMTEWNYVIRGEKTKKIISYLSRAMVWAYYNDEELFDLLNSELDELLLDYDKGLISPSIGEHLFPLVIFSKMTEEYYSQDRICDELSKSIYSAIEALSKFRNEKKMSYQSETLFSECLTRLNKFFSLNLTEQLTILNSNSTIGGFSIDDIKLMLSETEKSNCKIESIEYQLDSMFRSCKEKIREIEEEIEILKTEYSGKIIICNPFNFTKKKPSKYLKNDNKSNENT
jgi:hypothetical protein